MTTIEGLVFYRQEQSNR